MYKNIKIKINTDLVSYEEIQEFLFSQGNTWSSKWIDRTEILPFGFDCLLIDEFGTMRHCGNEIFNSVKNSHLTEFEVSKEIILRKVEKETIVIQNKTYFLDDVVNLLKKNKLETISDILTPYGKTIQNAKTIVKDDIIGKYFDCKIQGVYVHGRIYEDTVYPQSIILGFLPSNSDIGWLLDSHNCSAILEDGYTHGWRLKKDLSNLEMENVTDLKIYVWKC